METWLPHNSSLKAFEICDERFQVILWQIYCWHAAPGHFGGGTLQELGHAVGRKLGCDADESRCCGSANSAVPMACIARLSLEDCLPFRSHGIGQGSVRGNQ